MENGKKETSEKDIKSKKKQKDTGFCIFFLTKKMN
jgi:hypothetical protein